MSNYKRRFRFVIYSLCAGVLTFTAAWVVWFILAGDPSRVTPLTELVETLAWGGAPIANWLDELFGVRDLGAHFLYIAPVAILVAVEIKVILFMVVFEGFLRLMASENN